MDQRISRLKALRKAMKASGADAYIIPASDPHLGEYVPAHWRVMAWMTGFTGSAGTVVVTQKFAGLWTDSRYFIQAGQQLSGSGFELVKLRIPHTPEYIEWLSENLKKKGVVGVNGKVLSIGLLKMMEKEFSKKNITIDISSDLIADLWTDRQPMPKSLAFEHPFEFAGVNRGSKIKAIREKMAGMGVVYQLLTSPDDIMWMLNIRGNDVDYCPLITSFALVTPDQVMLFVDDEQIPYKLKREFDSDGVVILPYDSVEIVLGRLQPHSSLLLHPGTTSAALYNAITKLVQVAEDVSIPTRLKSVKNPVEIENIRKTMKKDGVALTKFFYWLETRIGKELITEVSAADKLLGFRMEQEDCVGPSFATISAWKDHGASPH